MFTALILINILREHLINGFYFWNNRRDIKAQGSTQWKRQHTEFIELEDRMQTFLQEHESRLMQAIIAKVDNGSFLLDAT